MEQLVQYVADHAGDPLSLYVVIILSAGYLTKNVMIPLLRLRR